MRHACRWPRRRQRRRMLCRKGQRRELWCRVWWPQAWWPCGSCHRYCRTFRLREVWKDPLPLPVPAATHPSAASPAAGPAASAGRISTRSGHDSAAVRSWPVRWSWPAAAGCGVWHSPDTSPGCPAAGCVPASRRRPNAAPSHRAAERHRSSSVPGPDRAGYRYRRRRAPAHHRAGRTTDRRVAAAGRPACPAIGGCGVGPSGCSGVDWQSPEAAGDFVAPLRRRLAVRLPGRCAAPEPCRSGAWLSGPVRFQGICRDQPSSRHAPE